MIIYLIGWVQKKVRMKFIKHLKLGRKTEVIDQVGCLNSEDNKMLVKDEEIKE